MFTQLDNYQKQLVCSTLLQFFLSLETRLSIPIPGLNCLFRLLIYPLMRFL